MNIQDYKGVFVFAQQVDNTLSGIALELVGKGKELAKDLGTEVTAVLVGSDVAALADELAEYGADKVIVCLLYTSRRISISSCAPWMQRRKP